MPNGTTRNKMPDTTRATNGQLDTAKSPLSNTTALKNPQSALQVSAATQPAQLKPTPSMPPRAENWNSSYSGVVDTQPLRRPQDGRTEHASTNELTPGVHGSGQNPSHESYGIDWDQAIVRRIHVRIAATIPSSEVAPFSPEDAAALLVHARHGCQRCRALAHGILAGAAGERVIEQQQRLEQAGVDPVEWRDGETPSQYATRATSRSSLPPLRHVATSQERRARERVQAAGNAAMRTVQPLPNESITEMIARLAKARGAAELEAQQRLRGGA
jgi:hypothetical protein